MDVIWSLYSQYNKTNTILIDDERHKFIVNNKFAVQVKKCMQIGFIKDPELITLTKYLEHIAKSGQDLSTVGVRITNAYMTKQSEINF